MRKSMMVAALSAVITATAALAIYSGQQTAEAQTTETGGWSKAQATCILQHVSKAQTDKAAVLLFRACLALN